MKKKLSMCFLAALFVIKTISAQGYYTGKYYDYGPYYAYATYLGTTATTSAYAHYKDALENEEQSIFSVTITPLEKLSKQYSTLFWGALDAFDYEPGEVYWVQIHLNNVGPFVNYVYLFAEIEKNN